jgi:hypothetical protein
MGAAEALTSKHCRKNIIKQKIWTIIKINTTYQRRY